MRDSLFTLPPPYISQTLFFIAGLHLKADSLCPIPLAPLLKISALSLGFGGSARSHALQTDHVHQLASGLFSV